MLQSTNNLDRFTINIAGYEHIQETESNHSEKSTTAWSNFAKKLVNVFNTIKTESTKQIKNIGKAAIGLINSNFIEKLKSVFNFFHKATSDTAPNFHKFSPVSPREIRELVRDEVDKLNILIIGVEDEIYANQTIDAVLASTYSEAKDAFHKDQFDKKVKVSEDYLKAIGEIARQNGLEGHEQDGIFIPKGAGANPFITPVIGSIIKNKPLRLRNTSQVIIYKKFAAKLISAQVGQLCKLKGRITPEEMNLQLREVAKKYDIYSNLHEKLC